MLAIEPAKAVSPRHAQQHHQLGVIEALAQHLLYVLRFGLPVADLIDEPSNPGEHDDAVPIDETADDELEPSV